MYVTRYLSDSTLGRNFFSQLRYFMRYVCLKLTYVTRYLSDSAVWRFFLYPFYLHHGLTKHQKIGHRWKNIFKGYHLGAILSFQLKYFRRYVYLKLTYVTRYLSDSAVWRFFLYPFYLHHTSPKHQKIGHHWKDIFKGYHLGAILSSQLKYFRRYVCLKLMYVTKYLSDSALWRFFLYPFYLHYGSSKHKKIGHRWKDIFKGYHLSAISSSQLKYFRSYVCLKLTYVTRYL